MNLFKVVVASKLFKSLSAKSNLQTMVMKGLPPHTSPTKLKFRLKRDGIDYIVRIVKNVIVELNG